MIPTTAAPSTTLSHNTIRIENLVKTYGRGSAATTALRGVSLALPRGSFTAIMGPSGSGKSTFLQCAAGLDSPTEGAVHIGSTDISTLKPAQLSEFRRDKIGFVFQSYNLLSALTVEQNITLPFLLAGKKSDRTVVDHVLDAVGLNGFQQRRPAELSGGQQQRVAIARALVTSPDVLFADEPTGALDSRTGRLVLELLRRSAKDLDQTIVMVTHDPLAASFADVVVFLADGRFVAHEKAPNVQQIADRMTALGEW
ncbi:ABC transporter ATP-binding protein [Rhodococcus sp. 1168]|uniref:ABC transporter ATP-binding protein n=1 Tax=Rhodococcus sp. 1168 TaxID=2018041 RepID=UPI000A0BDA9A|nr:ABC transporter ATP-binding protein [Rhodococcus sp. 1168]ORI15442.1 ABC transporter [Rhodococcus sp. 1168]